MLLQENICSSRCQSGPTSTVLSLQLLSTTGWLSATDVIAARFTVVAIVPWRCGVAGSGRPVVDIRQANADGSCTPIAAGDFAPEAAA